MTKREVQSGQVVLILLLVISVALAIGLSIIQRSLVDISTASKVEQSSRAFSAAEAGVERALSGDQGVFSNGVNFQSDTNSEAFVLHSGLIPPLPSTNSRQVALEYPPLAKEEVAHVWLADPNSTTNPPSFAYHPSSASIDVYWATNNSDKPAIELTIIYYDGAYKILKKYYDYSPRNTSNGFEEATCTTQGALVGSTTYFCSKTLTGLPVGPSSGLILMRVRLLYNSTSQSFAVQGVGTCGARCSLPPQAEVYLSTGLSGDIQRTIKVFQMKKVVPPYLDYAIFSASEVRK